LNIVFFSWYVFTAKLVLAKSRYDCPQSSIQAVSVFLNYSLNGFLRMSAYYRFYIPGNP
jgi:hypothetical protein